MNTENKEFKWTDELVQEFLNDKEHPAYDWSKEISQFKQSKLKEEDKRIVVTCHELVNSNRMLYGFSFQTPIISNEKTEAVINIIERLLNGEMDNPAPSESIPTLERQDSKDDKEWEVESYINITTHEVFTIGSVWNDSFYREGFKNNTGGFSTNEFFKINSVRRLSDNVVFTVGDKVNYGTIEKIVISWVGLEVQFVGGSGATLASIEKLPKQMYAKHCGIHDYNDICKGMKCEEYNPINPEHNLKPNIK